LKLPRDLAGTALASLLRRYGYEITRQTGSHLRLGSTLKGSEHHVTIPRHKEIKVGTLSSILTEIASYLETDREQLTQELFGR
jgi:predicted RNA binding protein YcfA (HicA-like mRNA interferase family)